MRASALLLALAPGLAVAESRYVTWNSPASGYIGTNPHDRDYALYEDQDGVMLPVIWEVDNAGFEALGNCAFEPDPATGGSRRGESACPVELVVDVLDDDGRRVLIVKRLVALGRPGQKVSFQ